jgi:hypothetical protein
MGRRGAGDSLRDLVLRLTPRVVTRANAVFHLTALQSDLFVQGVDTVNALFNVLATPHSGCYVPGSSWAASSIRACHAAN